MRAGGGSKRKGTKYIPEGQEKARPPSGDAFASSEGADAAREDRGPMADDL